MPVFLRPERQDSWLDDDSAPVSLRRLLAPFPASEMASHPVSYDVNHPKIDDEYLTQPVEANIGVTPSLF
jgi:putative SOS response-associated peptidase YedK